MKSFLVVAIFSLATCLSSIAEETNVTFKILGTRVERVLPLYKDISGLDLVIASNVRTVFYDITVENPSGKAVTRTEAMKLIESALVKQAAVIITRLDDKKASVTFNDALTVAPYRGTKGP